MLGLKFSLFKFWFRMTSHLHNIKWVYQAFIIFFFHSDWLSMLFLGQLSPIKLYKSIVANSTPPHTTMACFTYVYVRMCVCVCIFIMHDQQLQNYVCLPFIELNWSKWHHWSMEPEAWKTSKNLPLIWAVLKISV